jgi:hypothetical protein
MRKKPAKTKTAVDLSKDMWINPKSNLKGERGDRAWDNRLGVPSGTRFLELADIALGLKKPEPQKKKSAASGAHETDKTEPYSN